MTKHSAPLYENLSADDVHSNSILDRFWRGFFIGAFVGFVLAAVLV